MIHRRVVLAVAGLSLAAIHLSSPRPAAQAAVKVLLLYDMEGVTGARRPQDVTAGSDSYPATRESLTADVNAAIAGLLKAGATEVVITDGHGSGSNEPDYLLDQLPKGARFDLREVPYDPYIETMDKSFAAMVAIAMHGRAGGQGFLAHTYNGHTRWIMGGHDMNESMLVAASAARFDIPLILVTGDDVLQKEIAAFSPSTEYVVVKKAVTVESAEPRPRRQVSADIAAAAERALRGRGKVTPWKPALPSPFENRYGYILPEQAAIAINFPHASPVDNKTVAIRTPDFMEAYLTFRALAGVTGMATSRMMLGWLGDVEGGREIMRTLQGKLPSRTQRTFEPTGQEIPRPFGKHGYR
ncbi:MAG: M55 family metallopeptidase [Acidobacteriota bacterium]|nr:M55 family metallopeptidase [Acidobacteriota bacterium]MDQ3419972.1 M55 family metallopeptidase [Acidobacteriota bacterium]